MGSSPPLRRALPLLLLFDTVEVDPVTAALFPSSPDGGVVARAYRRALALDLVVGGMRRVDGLAGPMDGLAGLSMDFF
jgi:hypothetical protein